MTPLLKIIKSNWERSTDLCDGPAKIKSQKIQKVRHSRRDLSRGTTKQDFFKRAIPHKMYSSKKICAAQTKNMRSSQVYKGVRK